jgi:hypothetical protein
MPSLESLTAAASSRPLSTAIDTARRRRWITPEHLNVAPELVGQPLASPARRGWAMLIDLTVLALVSDLSGLWLWGGLAMVALQLRSRRGGATRGPRWVVGWIAATLVVLLALQQAPSQWEAWRQRQAPSGAQPSASAQAPGAGDREADADADAAVDAAVDAVASASAGAQPQTGAQTLAAAAQVASDRAARDERRIAALEAELRQARQKAPRSLRAQLEGLVDDFGLSLGWGIVYFSLLPAWWGGQTVGKKLLGLRVVELTGKPMTVMRSLKRYGGYAAGMATGGLGLIQLLWDPNRQAIQDKTAHTAVIDLRALSRSAPDPQGGS